VLAGSDRGRAYDNVSSRKNQGEAGTEHPAVHGLAARGIIYVPIGWVALQVVALGLVVFGIYGLCKARWQRV
jgi:hypothetical protein